MVIDEHWVNKMKIKLNCRMFWKGKANFNWLNMKHMHWTLLNCFHSAHTAAIHTHYPHCNPIRLWMCVRECECIHTEQARFNGPLCDIIIIILCECDYSGRLCVCGCKPVLLRVMKMSRNGKHFHPLFMAWNEIRSFEVWFGWTEQSFHFTFHFFFGSSIKPTNFRLAFIMAPTEEIDI